MKYWLATICVLGVFSLCGCGTVETKRSGGFGETWSGTRLAYYRLNKGGPWHPWPILVIVVADVPLSAAADTLLLPVDLLCRNDTPDFGDATPPP